MEFEDQNCLHCLIFKEIGRRLENGQICGKGALEKLAMVMAEIVATAPVDERRELINGISVKLWRAEAEARQRVTHKFSIAPKSSAPRKITSRRATLLSAMSFSSMQ
jgi:hypothetical protein